MEVIQRIEKAFNCKIYDRDLAICIIEMAEERSDVLICATFFDDHVSLYAWNNKYQLWDDIGGEFSEGIAYNTSTIYDIILVSQLYPNLLLECRCNLAQETKPIMLLQTVTKQIDMSKINVLRIFQYIGSFSDEDEICRKWYDIKYACLINLYIHTKSENQDLIDRMKQFFENTAMRVKWLS